MNKEKHQNCIDLIDAINHFKTLKSNYVDILNGAAGSILWFRLKYEHKIVIMDMCIERLIKRYDAIIMSL